MRWAETTRGVGPVCVGTDPPCVDLLARAQGICDLLDVRDGVTEMPGFNHDEIMEAIEVLCCY